MVLTDDFYNKVRLLLHRINTLKERQEELMASLEKSTVYLTDLPRSTSPKDKLVDGLSTLGELEEKEREARLELEYLRLQAEEEIEVLTDPTQQLVMRMRYIDGMKWKKIAGALHYSEDHCFKIHRIAKRTVNNSINNDIMLP
ncbi:MAG: DUF1492 domain-containing protein [Christensenellaceae bacterium]|jgi:DNA-directed RNA polymerase specialized sigma subunit